MNDARQKRISYWQQRKILERQKEGDDMRRFDPRRFVLTQARHPQASPDALRRWLEASNRYDAAQSHFAAAADADAVEAAVLALQAAEKQKAEAWQALRESGAVSSANKHRTS